MLYARYIFKQWLSGFYHIIWLSSATLGLHVMNIPLKKVQLYTQLNT